MIMRFDAHEFPRTGSAVRNEISKITVGVTVLRMSCPFGYTADGKDDGVAAAAAGCPAHADAGAAKDESGDEKARYFCRNVTYCAPRLRFTSLSQGIIDLTGCMRR